MPENLVLPADAVRVRGLDKTYAASGKRPAKEALKAIDLAIPRGSLFGLLGPNGAGKSTLINILAQLVNKTAGEVQVWGFDLDRRPRRRCQRHRRGAAGTEHRSFLHPARTSRSAGRSLWRAQGRAAHRRDSRCGRSERPRQFLCPHAVGRHAPTAACRQGAGPQPASAGAGRAHRRRRCRTAPAALALCARVECRRHHRAADHALPGRGRAACAIASPSSTTAG